MISPGIKQDPLLVFLFLVLHSALETEVPARGKALIPTDLSFAIPEGTYARIGKSHFVPFNLCS